MKNVVRIITMTLVCFSIGIMISWQYKSIAINNQLLVFQRTSIEALQEELIEQQRVNEELEERLKEVNKEIEYYSYAMDDIGKIDRTIKRK